jgi:hydrogenase maturation protein HypF
MARERRRLRVTGTVQGVGFRPFVYRLARELGLGGFVRNDSEGVLIEVEGPPQAVAELCRRLVTDAPPLARIAGLAVDALAPAGDEAFAIVASEGGAPAVPVSVDIATCAECLAELADPADRRHRYPFTNCTNCGPRYTIVREVPYDRPATTMAAFEMCAACRREYEDPADRRFHAQPNACPACGPTLTLRTPAGRATAAGEAALAGAVAALLGGQILAVKGIGGYHLACDATSDAVVGELRRRKARDDKPFALMVADLATAAELCELDAAAVAALVCPRRPIVLSARRPGAPVAAAVAPGLPELGVMLPYSPLHHLLLEGVGRPLVMTSGNLTDEPIAHTDDDAVSRLGPLVDAILTHDRPIHIRCDDSVARVTGGRVQLLRRSRGYAPEPLRVPWRSPCPVLAVGAELKSTVAVARDDWVVASHHIGDLEHLANHAAFEQAVVHLCRLFGVEPAVVAHDLHPEYLSTKFAAGLGLPTIGVQHHHAHVAACLAEHAEDGPVLGVAFDGLGYGDDGTLWGGEFLVADRHGYRRVGHLRPVTLPGGVAAIREPWRMAVSWASAALGPAAAASVGARLDERWRPVLDLSERGAGPTTTAVGRLFDAVAALVGVRGRVSYEAQAAIELEALARRVPREAAPVYEVEVRRAGDRWLLDPAPALAEVVRAHAAGVPPELVAAGFHEGLGRATAAMAARLARREGLGAVVLTGGAFQNVRLTEVVTGSLAESGLRVLCHGDVPPNDGGISVGQAVVAAARAGEPADR